jgi:hypothetical protein
MELRRSVAATRFVPKAIDEEVIEEVVAEAPTVVDAFTRELTYRMDAEADLEEDDEEEIFNAEASLANPVTYTWEDKYRPRKPRYLNRVHTGYEWNKYNQTHYEYTFSTNFVDGRLNSSTVLTIHHRRSSRATSSTYFIQISSINRKHLPTS